MSTPPSAALLYCHGLDCSWTGTFGELNKSDTSKPPACPRCGSFTPNKKRREVKQPIGEPAQPGLPGAAPPALAEAVARISADRLSTAATAADVIEPDGVKVDTVVEEYEAAVIDLYRAERALQAAQARAQAALRALNQGILGRAGLE